MIIGLNGYIGSGKDTVGAMIQEITRTPMDGDKGYKNMEGNIVPLLKNPTHWYIKKFAEKLKQTASLLTGIPRERFEDQDFKKTYLGKEWDYPSVIFVDHLTEQEQRDFLYGLEDSSYLENNKLMHRMTVREFLQKLGTEAARYGLHTNTWVNALFSDYVCIGTYSFVIVDYSKDDEPAEWIGEPYDIYPNWVITDTRFPNEAQAIKDKGGIIVRINRALPTADYETLEQKHPSETSLDNWDFDHVIENNMSKKELYHEVEIMLNKFQIT